MFFFPKVHPSQTKLRSKVFGLHVGLAAVSAEKACVVYFSGFAFGDTALSATTDQRDETLESIRETRVILLFNVLQPDKTN